MSTTWEDIAYDEYMQDQYMEDLYNKHIEQFTEERLVSYYLENKDIALPAVNALNNAKSLFEINTTAALIFAAISQEYTIKTVLLKPLVYGLVNNDTVANIITKFSIGVGGPSKFKELLWQLLAEHGGVNLNYFPGVKKILWEEICEIATKRNFALHEANECEKADAENAIKVAEILLNSVYPIVMKKLGLLIEGNKIIQ